MSIQYHPAVEQDIADALKYYDEVSLILGDEFKKELRHFIKLAGANPKDFILSVPNSAGSTCGAFPITFYTAKFLTASALRWFDTTSEVPITA